MCTAMNETAVAPLHDREEAAKILRVSTRQVGNLIASGDLAHVKIRGSVRFRPDDLKNFIESRTVRSK
jgi:excisionase family DNA binding protein